MDSRRRYEGKASCRVFQSKGETSGKESSRGDLKEDFQVAFDLPEREKVRWKTQTSYLTRKRLVRLIVPLIVEQVLAVTVGMARYGDGIGAGETAVSESHLSIRSVYC